MGHDNGTHLWNTKGREPEIREPVRENRDRDNRDANSSASHNGKPVSEPIGTWCPVSLPNNTKEPVIIVLFAIHTYDGLLLFS